MFDDDDDDVDDQHEIESWMVEVMNDHVVTTTPH